MTITDSCRWYLDDAVHSGHHAESQALLPYLACRKLSTLERDARSALSMFPRAYPFSSTFAFSCRRIHTSTPRRLWPFRTANINVPAIYKARRESWITPTMVLIGIMPIFTFSLGVWQLQRLKWKINLIDELEEKLQLRPLSLPPNIKFSNFPPSQIFI